MLKKILDRTSTPTRILATSASAFLMYGSQAAQDIKEYTGISGFRQFLGNVFYGFLDLKDKISVTFLNTVDSLENLDDYKDVGEYGLGASLGLWASAGLKKTRENTLNIKSERVKDLVDSIAQTTTAGIISAYSNLSNINSDVAKKGLEGLVNSIPETLNGIYYGTTNDDTLINTLVATLALKGGYKFVKSVMGFRYNQD